MISFKKILLGTAAIGISFGSIINFQQPAEAGFFKKLERGVRGVGRKIDPTNPNSVFREIGRRIDPTKRRGSQETSCLAVDIYPTKYRLVNRTSKVIYYRLNGRSYKIAPTYRRVHKVGGSSSSSQILSAVEDNRTLIWWLPQWGDAMLVFLFSSMGVVIIWFWQNRTHQIIAISSTAIILYILCWFAFTKGGWFPLLPSTLALLGTGGIIIAKTYDL